MRTTWGDERGPIRSTESALPSYAELPVVEAPGHHAGDHDVRDHHARDPHARGRGLSEDPEEDLARDDPS